MTVPSLIDSFLVEVGLDPSGYQKGSKEVTSTFDKTKESARRSAVDMEDYGKKSSAFFGKLKTEALGLFLAFAGASSIKAFVGDLLDGDASAGRLAKNLGVATQSVSAYRMVVRSLGGEAGDADSTLQLLASARESLRLTGTTGHDAELMRLGVTKEDLQDPMKALEAIAKTGETMKREDYFAVLSRLGIPPGAIESLNRGKRGLDDMIEAKKRDGAATDADAEAAQKFQAKLSELESKIMGAVRPALYSLVDGLLDFNTRTDAVNTLLPVLIGLVGAAGTAALIATAPYVALAAAIASVVIAYEDWQRIQNLTPKQREGFEARGAQIRADAGKALAEGRIGDALGILGSAFVERASGNPSMYGGQGPAAAGVSTGGATRPIGPGGRRVMGWTPRVSENSDASVSNKIALIAQRIHAAADVGLTHEQFLALDMTALEGTPAGRNNLGNMRTRTGAWAQFATKADYERAQRAWLERRYKEGARTVRDAVEGHLVTRSSGVNASTALRTAGTRSTGGNVSIGTLNVNAPNADAGAVADKVPTAIKARLSLSQGNQALLG